MPSASVHIIDPSSIPNPDWLRPGMPSAGQQSWGDAFSTNHTFVLIPSVVATQSWSLIFISRLATGTYSSTQEVALDPRLHAPAAP
jgi:RES domain-containing protein